MTDIICQWVIGKKLCDEYIKKGWTIIAAKCGFDYTSYLMRREEK